MAAASHAGPAITISFIVAKLWLFVCGFVLYSRCFYMIPVAGSAYTTYSWLPWGGIYCLDNWLDLVLEYAVGAATVGISWSQYLVKFLEGLMFYLPHELTIAGPWDGGIINLPAVAIIVLMSLADTLKEPKCL
jgi:APA family basic amino acid/polyamine antiporter